MNVGATSHVSAIILAGNKNSRMGTPKFLLHFDGEPLISHVVRRCRIARAQPMSYRRFTFSVIPGGNFPHGQY
jgi:molybdopterin-guanine dinucleotide biosynthesis protein A